MADIEKAVQWCEAIAKDNSHGYSQANRQGPDYDCSSLILNGLSKAGFNVGSVNGYTGTMRTQLKQAGFTEYAYKKGMARKRGDILLNVKYHTAMCISSTQIVEAASNRGNPKTGDQTGTEILTRSFYEYPTYGWDYLYRYEAAAPEATGWIKDDKGWWYRNADGSYPKECWKCIDGKWYYFGADGYMLSDAWVKHTDGYWYYLGKDGAMVKDMTLTLDANGRLQGL